MVLSRRTFNQELPSEIAENILKFIPRPGKETSGTIHSKFKNGQSKKTNGVRKTIQKKNGVLPWRSTAKVC